MEEKFEVKKVLVRKDGVKIVIIPKSFEIKQGDYVVITKLNKQEEKHG